MTPSDRTNWSESLDAFTAAAERFADLVPAGRQRWDEPALGEWTVRDLTGHTSRALLTVETYLGTPAAEVDVATAAEYFTLALAGVGDPAAVAQRGRDAGATLGDDPAAQVTAIVGRVLGLVREASPDALVGTPVGGMRLRDYLPTRTFELTVHGLDLARVLDQPLETPPTAADESLAVLAALTAQRGQSVALLTAATGRGPLPDGFTVL